MKRFFSLALAIMVLVAIPAVAELLPGEYKAVTASYATGVHAVPAVEYNFADNPNIDLRDNVLNSLGAPDAVQGYDRDSNTKFTGMRYYESVTYYFKDEDLDRMVYNHPDSETPDISLIEVTWSDSWHVEAMDVYLLNAVVDGELVPGLTFVGTAFNRIGINQGLADSDFCRYRKVDFRSYTDIYLPENISKAEAIQLRDVTTRYNATDHGSYYYASDDGFDLDAIYAWYTVEETYTSGGLSVKKVDGDGAPMFGEEFCFDLFASLDDIGNDEAIVMTAVTDPLTSIATFTGLEPNTTYYVVERLTAAQAVKYIPAQPYIIVTSSATDAVDTFEVYPFANNEKEPGGLIVYKELTGGKTYSDSITGRGIDFKDNNWFEYTKVSVASAQANGGYSYALIGGRDQANAYGDQNKISNFEEIRLADPRYGYMTVRMDDKNVYIDMQLDAGGTFTDTMKVNVVAKSAKDADPFYSIKTAPGQQPYTGTLSADKTSGTLTVPLSKIGYVAGKSDVLYVYLHSKAQGTIYMNDVTPDTVFYVKVTGPSFPDGEVFAFSKNVPLELDDLLPGEYTIVEVMDADGTPIDRYFPFKVTYINATVTVISGQTVTAKVTNEPIEPPARVSGVLSFKKVNQFGAMIFEPFKFELYTFDKYDESTHSIKPGAAPICEVESENGYFVFDSDQIIAGEKYVVCERMTDAQLLVYGYTDGGIQVFEAVDEASDYEAIPFSNLELGTMSGHKFRQYLNGDVQPLEGWWIRLEKYNDELDAFEPFSAPIQTAADGSYSFSGLTDGLYRVTEAIDDNWTEMTLGTVREFTVDLTGKTVYTGEVFEFVNQAVPGREDAGTGAGLGVEFGNKWHNMAIAVSPDALSGSAALIVGQQETDSFVSYEVSGDVLMVAVHLNGYALQGEKLHLDVKNSESALATAPGQCNANNYADYDTLTFEVPLDSLEGFSYNPDETFFIYAHLSLDLLIEADPAYPAF